MAAPLTARQAEVLRYITGHIAEFGFPPSGRELARGCGLGSPSGAHRMLVLLESKGYLTRSRRLSRGLSVATSPITVPTNLGPQDSLVLLSLASWISFARDAELIMAARTQDLEAKSVLIDAARERNQQACSLKAVWRRAADIEPAFRPQHHPAFVIQDDKLHWPRPQDQLLNSLPRCENWESFVIDQLVCNRFSWHISEYVSRTRPEVHGLLWGHTRLSERAVGRAQRWTCDLLDSQTGAQEFDRLSASARSLAERLYLEACSLDAFCSNGQSLLSGAIDTDEVAMLA